MKCKKHPKYKVIRKPQCDCITCWAMWKEKQKSILTTATADDKCDCYGKFGGYHDISCSWI